MEYSLRTLPIVADGHTASVLTHCEGIRPFGRPGFRIGDIVQQGLPGWYNLVIADTFWSVEMWDHDVYLIDHRGMVIGKALGDSLSRPADYQLKALSQPYAFDSSLNRVLLPERMSCDGYDVHEVLQGWGIARDSAVAPAGWWFARLPHGWSLQLVAGRLRLLDGGGRLRGRMLFTSNELVLHRRLRLSDSFNLGNPNRETFSVVNSDDVSLYVDQMETEDEAEADAKYRARNAWMNYHYPKWDNPLAYWDDNYLTWTHRFVPGLYT